MSNPTLAVLVRFKSPLSLDEVRQVMNSRMDEFRALEGLKQKYYLQDSVTGEYGGLYLWDSTGALAAYRESKLRETIAEAYRTEGEPRVEVFSVLDVLRDSTG